MGGVVSCPYLLSALKPQPRERAWENQRGKRPCRACSSLVFTVTRGARGVAKWEAVPRPSLELPLLSFGFKREVNASRGSIEDTAGGEFDWGRPAKECAGVPKASSARTETSRGRRAKSWSRADVQYA
ncbi:hypothetical protein EVAR_64968_1 [Eumeta japonica]|uniref:Uncharacterized protein n=1 Tax=Eumeta variegata TaxID=151549 RepID=A0A4C1ZN81_EUMVA|nr:hypothetical protein EVAR_64968_1 [Eumeta japonica]